MNTVIIVISAIILLIGTELIISKFTNKSRYVKFENNYDDEDDYDINEEEPYQLDEDFIEIDLDDGTSTKRPKESVRVTVTDAETKSSEIHGEISNKNIKYLDYTDDITQLTCRDAVMKTNSLRHDMLNNELMSIVKHLNQEIINTINSSYKKSVSCKLWDTTNRGLDFYKEVLMPLAKFYEKKGFNVKIKFTNNTKVCSSRDKADIDISWDVDIDDLEELKSIEA